MVLGGLYSKAPSTTFYNNEQNQGGDCMKYTFHNERIPQEARQELNEKILYLVDQDLAEREGITREDIFNAYTGDGGLHG